MGSDTKQAIFEAATDLFAREGYNSVSVRALASAVDIKASAIYNHYRSKEEILDTIFDWYEDNLRRYAPSVDELLALVGYIHPHDILKGTVILYPDEILPAMSKSMLIANTLGKSNPRAERIMTDLLERARFYDRPILEKLLGMNLIEPIDINAFMVLHANYCYSAAVRYYDNYRMDTDDYIKGLELLFQLVRVRA